MASCLDSASTAPWSNGQDVGLSRLKFEFDSRRGYRADWTCLGAVSPHRCGMKRRALPVTGSRAIRSSTPCDEQLEQRLLGVEPVLGLVPDRRPFAIEDACGDLLARVRRKAVERDRPLGPERQQLVVERERARGRPGAAPRRPRRPCSPTHRCRSRPPRAPPRADRGCRRRPARARARSRAASPPGPRPPRRDRGSRANGRRCCRRRRRRRRGRRALRTARAG